MSRRWLIASLASCLLLPAAASVTDDAVAPPAHWTPSAFASDEYESTPAFAPGGEMIVFMRADREFDTYWLLKSTCTGRGWSAPVPPDFAAPRGTSDADPFFTIDGRRLYFVSARPFDGKHGDDFDIWFVDRIGATWGEPRRLPEPVNSPQAELLPRVAASGAIYFGSDRAGGLGGNDIYRATAADDGTWRVENLGTSINSAANEYEAEIASDERTMIVVSDRHVRSRLYRYRREGDAWTPLGRIPASDDVFQVGPVLSPRGDRLLFAQADGDRSGEIFLSNLSPSASTDWPPRCERTAAASRR